MKFNLNRFLLVLLLGVAVTPSACQQIDDKKLSKDQKEILTLYVSEYLVEEYQHLYFKLEESLSPLNPPLTSKDFEVYKMDFPEPFSNTNPVDSLFSTKELKRWSQQISAYKPILWNKKIFSDSVSLIQEEVFPNISTAPISHRPGRTRYLFIILAHLLCIKMKVH